MHVESLGIQTIPRDMDYMCILLFILYIYALSIFPLRIEILVVINFFCNFDHPSYSKIVQVQFICLRYVLLLYAFSCLR
jgi:hypothetical protein